MLGFVVPVKPRALSKDWHLETLLLERTTRSICAQVGRDFRLVVIYDDKPELDFTHPNMVLVKYPFPRVGMEDVEDLTYALKYYKPDDVAWRMDKGKKIHFGCRHAIELGCEYVMGVDSDDLVSNRIAAFVAANSPMRPAGWRIRRGYVYREGSATIIYQPEIQDVNGSTHIIRKDLITIPDFSTNRLWDYSLFESHAYTAGRIRDFHGEHLLDYPNPGVVYVAHPGNYSGYLRRVEALTARNVAKKIVRGRLITRRIRREFGLYALPVVPK